MKNFIRLERSRAARLAVSAAALAVAVASGSAAEAGHAASAKKAEQQFPAPTLEQGVLTIEGTNAADRIALRLQARQPGVIQVDVGDDGSADFSFDRSAVAAILVQAGSGDDAVRIDEGNGVFGDTIRITLDGGNGNDRLVGGAGAETLRGGNGDDTLVGGGAGTLSGGNGNDTVDGNKGNDVARLGNGDDIFVWDPGDGSDTIEGWNGEDTMVFNGAGAAERVDLSANGDHLRFFRDVAGITMDTHGVERVDFNALGGADLVTVNDLRSTDVRQVDVDLAGSLGGVAGDGAADRVVVDATNGDDRIDVVGDAQGVDVTGLAPTVRVLHSEAAADRLEINTLAGADSVASAGLTAGVIQLLVDGVLVQ